MNEHVADEQRTEIAGAAGFAAEDLRIIRGTFIPGYGTFGRGWKVGERKAGYLTIKFDKPFSSIPSVTVSPGPQFAELPKSFDNTRAIGSVDAYNFANLLWVRTIATDAMVVGMFNSNTGVGEFGFSFIVVGPR